MSALAFTSTLAEAPKPAHSVQCQCISHNLSQVTLIFIDVLFCLETKNFLSAFSIQLKTWMSLENYLKVTYLTESVNLCFTDFTQLLFHGYLS